MDKLKLVTLIWGIVSLLCSGFIFYLAVTAESEIKQVYFSTMGGICFACFLWSIYLFLIQ